MEYEKVGAPEVSRAAPELKKVLPEKQNMIPMIPVESMSGAIEFVCCFFSLLAAMVTYCITRAA